MAYIDQTQTKREIDDVIRGNTVSNVAPTKVSDDVQLVLNVNPKDYRRTTVIASSTSTGTIATASLTKKTYITAFSIDGTTITAGSSNIRLTVTPKGSTSTIIGQISCQPTALIDSVSAHDNTTLNSPMELEPGSLITVSSAGTWAGRYTFVFGYEVEL